MPVSRPPRHSALVVAITLALSGAAQAATITVTDTADAPVNTVMDQCLLRDAVAAANGNAPSGGCPAGEAGADQIEFAPGLAGAGILLTEGRLSITESLDITAPGTDADRVTLSAGNASGIFYIPGVDPTTMTLTGLQLVEGDAGAAGGAVHARAQTDLTLADCVVGANSADAGGGIAFLLGDNGRFALQQSTVVGNNATGNGGGLRLTGLSEANRLLVEITDSSIGGNAVGGAIAANGGGVSLSFTDTTLLRTTIIGNTADNAAGGMEIRNSLVSMSDSDISGNTALGGSGGALLQTGPGGLDVRTTRFAGNTAFSNGGGLVVNDVGGSIRDATILGNSHDDFGSAGGLTLRQTGTFLVSNVTLVGNTGTVCGGLYTSLDAGDTALEHLTVAGNTATSASAIAGGLCVRDGVRVRHVISTMNSSPDGRPMDLASTSGLDVDVNWSLITDATGFNPLGAENLVGVTAGLGARGDNGGSGVVFPNQTLPLQPGSPAIMAGDPGFAPPPDFDQRGPGFVRVANGRIDIGAFEFQGTPTTPELTLTPPALDFGPVEISLDATLTVVLSNTGAADLAIIDGIAPGAPFNVAGGTCGDAPFTLAAGADCSLIVTFSPLAAGDFADALLVTSNATSSPDTLPMQGQGVAAPGAPTATAIPVMNRLGMLLLGGALMLFGWLWGWSGGRSH